MSDLGKGGEEGEEEVECEADEHANFESRIQSLQSEVDTLAARLEEETQRHHQSLPLTQSSIRRHNETGEGPGASPEMRVLGQVASLMSSQLERQRREEERAARQRREELVRRLEEVEREGCAVRDHVDQLHTSLKKLVSTRHSNTYVDMYQIISVCTRTNPVLASTSSSIFCACFARI